MLRKDADGCLKQIRGMANASVPKDEHLNCAPLFI